MNIIISFLSCVGKVPYHVCESIYCFCIRNNKFVMNVPHQWKIHFLAFRERILANQFLMKLTVDSFSHHHRKICRWISQNEIESENVLHWIEATLCVAWSRTAEPIHSSANIEECDLSQENHWIFLHKATKVCSQTTMSSPLSLFSIRKILLSKILLHLNEYAF